MHYLACNSHYRNPISCSLCLLFDPTEDNVIKLLEENAPYQTQTNSHGQLVLHIACEKGKMRTIEMLSANKDLLTVRDNFGKIPLHYACNHFLEDSVRLLCELVPESITIQNNENLTPLHFATQYVNILSIVLNYIDRDHPLIQSLIEYATDKEYEESATMLRSFQNPLPTN